MKPVTQYFKNCEGEASLKTTMTVISILMKLILSNITRDCNCTRKVVKLSVMYIFPKIEKANPAIIPYMNFHSTSVKCVRNWN